MPSKSDKELILMPGGANANGGAPESEEFLPALDDMTPREIVAELVKYIVGQNAAKRAVAVALRNRVRRQKLPPEIAEDILPKNILMIGPTGVGKTEIARRLARLAGCPFVKVEASKYTEVGYVGRDVESMVRDLVEMSWTCCCRRHRQRPLEPRKATRRRSASRTSAPAKNCAHNCARANWTSAWWILKFAKR